MASNRDWINLRNFRYCNCFTNTKLKVNNHSLKYFSSAFVAFVLILYSVVELQGQSTNEESKKASRTENGQKPVNKQLDKFPQFIDGLPSKTKMFIKTSKAKYLFSEDIVLHQVFENNSDRLVHIMIAPGGRMPLSLTQKKRTQTLEDYVGQNIKIIVKYEDGNEVLLTSYAKQLIEKQRKKTIPPHFVAKPNSVSKKLYHLNRLFDMTRAGVYSVTVTSLVDFKSKQDFKATSNTLKIEVIEPEKSS